ncbi:MAG: GntR family transcriptional regulator [bacterium]|nr:GntR family transcriptional regulator [bacterium]
MYQATLDGKQSLTDQAYIRLEELVVTLQLEPGAVLSESSLSHDLGFGRTPIREALQRLAREGLVTILPRKGILVSEVNPRKQLLVLEARRELERLLARLCAMRRADDERELFLNIADEMERAAQADDGIGFMRLYQSLSALVTKAARNEYASNAMQLLRGISRRFWFMYYKEKADLVVWARLHADIARRVADADPQAAAEAADRLIDYAEEFTRATLDTANPALVVASPAAS